MPTIAGGDTFTQVVRFEVEPAKQGGFIAAIAVEVERWVRHRPGFVSSTFHAGLDGRHMMNDAQWRSEADFRAFARDPEGERLGASIRPVCPTGGVEAVQYRVVRSIEAPREENEP